MISHLSVWQPEESLSFFSSTVVEGIPSLRASMADKPNELNQTLFMNFTICASQSAVHTFINSEVFMKSKEPLVKAL